MEKLIRLLLEIIIIATGFMQLGGAENINYYKKDVGGSMNYYSINTGYIGNVGENDTTNVVISTKDELSKYIVKYDNKTWDLDGNEIDGELSKSLSEYDEQFFQKKSLALYYIDLTSGSQSVELDKPKIDGNTVTINYSVKRPEIGTCDMSGEIVVVEVDKGIEKINGMEK